MLSRSASLILLTVLLTGDFARAVEPKAPPEEPKSAQDALKAFLNACADADLKRMGQLYAPKVTVKKGSTILDKDYGGLGGDEGRAKDQTVGRDALLKAYERAIQQLGGKADWIKRGQRLKTFAVRFITDDSDNADKIFPAVGARRGDVLALVNPKGDALFFHLRKLDGKWRIIAEAWD